MVACIIGLVKDGDAGNFGNGFLKQFQKLAAEMSRQVCKAGNVPAGTGKAFNQARFYRIKPSAHHHQIGIVFVPSLATQIGPTIPLRQ